MNKYYPIMLDIKEKKCVVIGGGNIAYRKVLSLLECMAEVTVISHEVIPELKQLVDDGKVKYLKHEYNFKYISDCYLVYAATNNSDVNQAVYSQCSQKNILVNVVDKPEICNFIVPSKIKKGDLTIAISTNGKSPMLARKIRQDLEKVYDYRYELFLDIMGEVRKEVFHTLKDAKKRSEFYKTVVYSDYIYGLTSENKEDIQKQIISFLHKF
ncbi:precorrin-2 dehydrogenase/sirohydrochlorin ferrochelatase family protein [Clostridium akagii]|uniref:precorrin-2 dehydrogenase/sirohydrochlorin ferrochelatase family protein n=1 Tax=Clostridium akagii TaxID=91623 RepID=UPI00047E1AA5|nr:bifunctional precorrin-2 dehydrogenase/sirohydrochlorin ferrochelatase [Clostridium akagii]